MENLLDELNYGGHSKDCDSRRYYIAGGISIYPSRRSDNGAYKVNYPCNCAKRDRDALERLGRAVKQSMYFGVRK